MDEDYTEVKTFEQDINEKIGAIENDIAALKAAIKKLNKSVGYLEASNMLHHGVYR